MDTHTLPALDHECNLGPAGCIVTRAAQAEKRVTQLTTENNKLLRLKDTIDETTNAILDQHMALNAAEACKARRAARAESRDRTTKETHLACAAQGAEIEMFRRLNEGEKQKQRMSDLLVTSNEQKDKFAELMFAARESEEVMADRLALRGREISSLKRRRDDAVNTLLKRNAALEDTNAKYRGWISRMCGHNNWNDEALLSMITKGSGATGPTEPSAH